MFSCSSVCCTKVYSNVYRQQFSHILVKLHGSFILNDYNDVYIATLYLQPDSFVRFCSHNNICPNGLYNHRVITDNPMNMGVAVMIS